MYIFQNFEYANKKAGALFLFSNKKKKKGRSYGIFFKRNPFLMQGKKIQSITQSERYFNYYKADSNVGMESTIHAKEIKKEKRAHLKHVYKYVNLINNNYNIDVHQIVSTHSRLFKRERDA